MRERWRGRSGCPRGSRWTGRTGSTWPTRTTPACRCFGCSMRRCRPTWRRPRRRPREAVGRVRDGCTMLDERSTHEPRERTGMTRPRGSRASFFPAVIVVGAILGWITQGRTQPLPPPPPPPPSNQQVLEDITRTKHNLSSVDPSALLSSGVLPRAGSERDAKSEPGGTSEICVFCHTPHGASATGTWLKAPLWNRDLDYQATRTYQLYDQVWSFSFEGVLNDAAGQRPTGYSRLCLSCHDGTVALGNLINAPGSGGYQGVVRMTGNLGPGKTIPEGSGSLTGDTRRLGLDLRNDHAISFTFHQALVMQDRELVNPGPP